MKDAVAIAAYGTAIEAGWLRTVLEEHGIEARLAEEAFGTLYGGYLAPKDASVKVIVRAEDAERAAEILGGLRDEIRKREAAEEASLSDAQRRERVAHTAMRAALVGIVLVPPILHVYALWLLSGLKDTATLSAVGRRRVRIAYAVSLFWLVLVAVMVVVLASIR